MTKEKRNKIIKIVAIIVAVILLFLSGFLVGRKTIDETEKIKIEYIKLKPVSGTITGTSAKSEKLEVDTANIIKECIRDGIFTELFPTKYKYIKDIDTKEIYKYDSIYIPMTSEDTLQMVVDWAKKRYYSEVLFDIDTIGKCSISAILQYNRMDSLTYVFEPVQKQVTVTKYKTRACSPFIGLGWSACPGKIKEGQMINVQGGLFIKEKYGFDLMYQRDYINNKDFVGGNFIYKF